MWVSLSCHLQTRSLKQGRGFLPKQAHVQNNDLSKIFTLDFSNVAGYIFGYTSPTFPTSTCNCWALHEALEFYREAADWYSKQG